MCGVVGFVSGADRVHFGLEPAARAMVRTLRHRGPDDTGVWIDGEAGVALGHTRLAIIDLSIEGHQPMVSASRRYVISFNGEIYNHLELRRSLARLGHVFRGHSDTEVLVAGIEEWGVPDTVSRLNGMFAIAVWDTSSRTLSLVRDRLGEKPLYYGLSDNNLLFGSELKALLAFPGFSPTIDRDALALYLRHGCVPAPRSIYEGVFKLPPGSILSVRRDDSVRLREPKSYWSMAEVATGGISKPFDGTVEEAISELEALLHESVRLRMEADVPLGAFLSGGIDSSTVVALMQLQSHRPVRTFTIGSHDLGFNEADKARDLAEFLGTDHTQLYATAKDCAAVIPNLPRLYDEPFADSSQVPTAIVCELAREHVTVCLSGDGGDELFGGYNRHVWTEALLRKTDAISERVRLPVGRLARRISNKSSNPVGRNRLVEGSLDRLHKFGLVLNREGPSELYHSLTSIWPRPTDILLTGSDPEIPRGHLNDWGRANYTHALMYLDAISYLPDDILTKVDRASMGVSLEVRIPLLDHRVVELAWRLPLFMKISTPSGFHMRRGQGKWLLRQVLHRYVPPQLVDHPKMGFSVPIGSWLRDGIREWAEDLLAIGRLKQDGFFNPRIIRGIWDQHLEGDRDLSPYLWPVLMFQAWHDERYPVIQGVAPCS